MEALLEAEEPRSLSCIDTIQVTLPPNSGRIPNFQKQTRLCANPTTLAVMNLGFLPESPIGHAAGARVRTVVKLGNHVLAITIWAAMLLSICIHQVLTLKNYHVPYCQLKTL